MTMQRSMLFCLETSELQSSEPDFITYRILMQVPSQEGESKEGSRRPYQTQVCLHVLPVRLPRAHEGEFLLP